MIGPVDDLPLYEAILRRLVKFEIAGAPSNGRDEFGSHHDSSEAIVRGIG